MKKMMNKKTKVSNSTPFTGTHSFDSEEDRKKYELYHALHIAIRQRNICALVALILAVWVILLMFIH